MPVKKYSQIGFSIFLLGMLAFRAQAAFTSFYIFGDGLSATTNNSSAGQYYYGLRQSNGRVWVEVLAQRLGLGANSTTNVFWSFSPFIWSFFGQYSYNLMTNINNFKPTQPATTLCVVWVNDADFVEDMGNIYFSGGGTNSTKWVNAINQSLNSHRSIINNLYAKGCRTLIMPNAVDITEIPEFNGYPASDRAFIRQMIINFNNQFTSLLNQTKATLPGLTIYEPNYFGLLDNTLTNASAYGLTNALSYGISVDALSDPALSKKVAINGPGTNYIFWDPVDPSAKLHEIMGDLAVQMVAPVQFAQMAVLSDSTQATCTNRLDIINMPVGLNGFVDGTTNIGQANFAWTTVTNISSTSPNQSVFVNSPWLPPVLTPGGKGSITGFGGASGPSTADPMPVSPGWIQAYRLRFPYAWNWP